VTCFFAFSGIAGLRERVARRRRLNTATSLDALRALSWREFEHLVLAAYAKQGWSASLTQRGADGGADLILEGRGKKVLVQCKQWKTRQLGAPTIRELHPVMVTEKATSGIVVTCGLFSSEARALADTVDIDCVDGTGLLRLVALTRGERSTTQDQPAPPAVGEVPSCPRCASAMVQRRSSRGPFWGCSAYPRCRGTVDIQAG
jgi:restriction system protein